MSEYKYQHGLSIMRAQPFHIGHQKLIDRMLKECARVTIVLGSIQEQGTERNPLNYTTRKKMIQNVYRTKSEYERLKIIGLFDINNPAEWGEYVLDFITDSFPMVRDMIKFGDMRWKNFIAPENYHLVEEYFNKKKAII